MAPWKSLDSSIIHFRRHSFLRGCFNVCKHFVDEAGSLFMSFHAPGKVGSFQSQGVERSLDISSLSKQGRKQDLIDRIRALLDDDQGFAAWVDKNDLGEQDVANMINSTYRKMQVSGSGSRGQAPSSSGNAGNDGIDDTPNVRCLCGSHLPTGQMIKCEDPGCHVWQHTGCVIIPEKPMVGVSPPPPEVFFCKGCRLSRADPFWTTIANPLYPVKLITTSYPVDGAVSGLKKA